MLKSKKLHGGFFLKIYFTIDILTESCYDIHVYHRRIIMIAVRLPEDIENRLDQMAKKTGRTKTFYVREAILEHLEDLEDVYLAEKRLKTPGRKYTLDEVEKDLGLED